MKRATVPAETDAIGHFRRRRFQPCGFPVPCPVSAGGCESDKISLRALKGTGLVNKRSIPASRASFLAAADASPVNANIGILGRELSASCCLMIRVAVMPSMMGIEMSGRDLD